MVGISELAGRERLIVTIISRGAKNVRQVCLSSLFASSFVGRPPNSFPFIFMERQTNRLEPKLCSYDLIRFGLNQLGSLRPSSGPSFVSCGRMPRPLVLKLQLQVPAHAKVPNRHYLEDEQNMGTPKTAPENREAPTLIGPDKFNLIPCATPLS